MSDFVRGARVRKPVEKPLTLNEASFVMCEVARLNGIKDPKEFLLHMGRAWIAYHRATESERLEHGTK